MKETLEQMLSGGHPNSLGRTVDVVALVLDDQSRFIELFECYQSTDELVRLRVSNALRRVQAEKPEWLLPLMDRLIDEIAHLDQASAQWTLPKLFDGAQAAMSARQRAAALQIVKRNLAEHDDWIVLNNSMDYLVSRAMADEALREWLLPHLARLSQERRKSVARRAQKARVTLGKV